MTAGFTGTRKGMTQRQKNSLKERLLGVTEFHHGCCVGADADAHGIALEMKISIIGHPPTDQRLMAKGLTGYTEMREPKPFLDRNKDIVDESEFLIAAPETEEETLRSGTWSTVRYARKQKKQRQILLP